MDSRGHGVPLAAPAGPDASACCCPKAIGGRPFEEYSYVDGEIVAGSVLGWNFGDGHLADERLLACDPGAVRLRGRRAARDLRRVAAAPRLDAALADRRRASAACSTRATPSSTSSPGAQALGLRRGLSHGRRRRRRLRSERARRGDRAGARRARRCASSRRATRSAAARAPPSSRCPASRTTSARAAIRWAILSPFFRTPAARRARPALDPAAGVGRAPARRRAGGAAAALARRDGARARRGRARLPRGSSRRSCASRTSCSPTSSARCASRGIRSAWRASGCRACCPRRRRSRARFRGERARALLAGCAAHSILPLERPLTAAVAMIFALTGARRGLAGRRRRLAGDRPRARRRYLRAARRPHRDRRARALARRPAAGARRPLRHQPGAARRHRRADPARAATCAGCAAIATAPASSSSTGRSTARSRGAIRAASRRRPCTSAARSRRSPPPRPRCGAASIPSGRSCSSCSRASSTRRRAPAGKHTGYAYCHVPAGSTSICTGRDRAADRALRARLSRPHPRAPRDAHRGSRARQSRTTSAARSPAASPTCSSSSRGRWRGSIPYSTPNPRVFLCSASTPPGGGVHGMCGYFAARSARRRLDRLPTTLPELGAAP